MPGPGSCTSVANPVVPFSHGAEALFDAAPGPKIHLWVDAEGHADVMDVAGDAYDRAIRDLLGLAAGPHVAR